MPIEVLKLIAMVCTILVTVIFLVCIIAVSVKWYKVADYVKESVEEFKEDYSNAE